MGDVGNSIVLFIEESPVLWAGRSWLLAVYLVGKPRLGGVAGLSSAETEFRLWLGQAPRCWNWFEEREEPLCFFPNRNLILAWLWSFQ